MSYSYLTAAFVPQDAPAHIKHIFRLANIDRKEDRKDELEYHYA